MKCDANKPAKGEETKMTEVAKYSPPERKMFGGRVFLRSAIVHRSGRDCLKIGGSTPFFLSAALLLRASAWLSCHKVITHNFSSAVDTICHLHTALWFGTCQSIPMSKLTQSVVSIPNRIFTGTIAIKATVHDWRHCRNCS